MANGSDNAQTAVASRPLRSGRPTREAALQLGTAILDVALQHFLHHGFEGASMDTIAADAQVSKRTLYQRFESKRGLLIAVRDRERRNYLRLSDMPLPQGGTRERLAAAALTMLNAAVAPKAMAFLRLKCELERHGLDIDDDARQVVATSWVNALRAILAVDDRLAKESPDRISALADFLFDLLVTVPHARITMRGDLADTDAAKSGYIQRALDMIVDGFPFLRQ